MGNYESSFNYVNKKYTDVDGYYLQDVVIPIPIKYNDVICNSEIYFIVGYSPTKKKFTTYCYGEVGKITKINEDDPSPPNKKFVISLFSTPSFISGSLLYYYDRQNSEGTDPIELDEKNYAVFGNIDNITDLNDSWLGTSEKPNLLTFSKKSFKMIYNSIYYVKFVQCGSYLYDKKLIESVEKEEIDLDKLFSMIRTSLVLV